MLRGDEIVYVDDLSPYGLAHVVEEELSYIAYIDFNTKFKPHKKVAIGSSIATTDQPVSIGTVKKMAKRAEAKQHFVGLKMATKKSMC